MALMLLALAACRLLAAQPEAPPGTTFARHDQPVRLQVEGDSIHYDVDRRRATLAGNVRIRMWAPGYSDDSALVLAERVVVAGSIITAQDGARLNVGPVLLRGDDLWFDASKQEFRLARPTGSISLERPEFGPGTAPVVVYFSGAEVSSVGGDARVSRARFTTCDRAEPHYELSCGEVTFSPASGELAVRKAALRLYGLRIPLAPRAKTRVGGPEREPGLTPPLPGYSSTEGAYVQHSFRLTDADHAWDAAAALRVSRRQGVVGAAWALREIGPWDVNLRVARREAVADNVTERLALYRLPEAAFTYHFFEREDPGAALDFRVSLGDFKEEMLRAPADEEPVRPRVHERRALAALGYAANASAQRSGVGDWYGATGRVSAYSSGDTFGALELYAGLGGRLTGALSGHATLRHHFTTGATPFVFDDVDIKTELQAGLSWTVTDKWGLDGWGRYDLDSTDMRDYRVGVSYRAHCLTWGLFYRDLGNRIGVQVNLHGLSGPEPAPAAPAAQAGACDAGLDDDRGKEM